MRMSQFVPKREHRKREAPPTIDCRLLVPTVGTYSDCIRDLIKGAQAYFIDKLNDLRLGGDEEICVRADQRPLCARSCPASERGGPVRLVEPEVDAEGV